MDWIRLIPTLFSAYELINKLRQAVRDGASVMDIIKTKGPEVLEFFQQIGKQLFPGLTAEEQAAAGATRIDVELVKSIQEALNKLDSAGLVVDGSYGPRTKAAVTKFQQANGLDPDGWAGKLTQAKIAEKLKALNPA